MSNSVSLKEGMISRCLSTAGELRTVGVKVSSTNLIGVRGTLLALDTDTTPKREQPSTSIKFEKRTQSTCAIHCDLGRDGSSRGSCVSRAVGFMDLVAIKGHRDVPCRSNGALGRSTGQRSCCFHRCREEHTSWWRLAAISANSVLTSAESSGADSIRESDRSASSSRPFMIRYLLKLVP